jgi:hypothetical protein
MTSKLAKARRRRLAKLILLCAAQDASESARKQYFSDPNIGKKYVNDLLNCNHESRIYRVLRMKLETFYALQDWLKQKAGVIDSRKGVTVEEKLVMFLFTVNNRASTRQVQEHFGRGAPTVSRYFHQILQALLDLHLETVQLPDKDTPLGERISKDPKYCSYFTDCLGALDGTHIKMHIPLDKQPRYRNRKERSHRTS